MTKIKLTLLAAGLSLTATTMAQAHSTFQTAAETTSRAVLQFDQVAAEGPAPTVTLASSTHAQGEQDNQQMAGGPVGAGDLEISGGAVKAMLPGAKVGGGGFVVKNTGGTDDRLLAVESPAAGRVELHEMKMENDVMKMRKLDDGVAIPAGATVELKSGGLHLMFMEVKKPFAEGETVPVTLTFEKAGKVDYVLPVGAATGGHKHN
ncbi:copper(I)-binding protein [Ensifer mexicanus]|uniref:Copper chaperone PCu(A)C n=1 Tax=Sinorhizobium mexicanum TaxID=375549 RepID=A0A859QEU8_9HYPH|nr:copper chaperone PCu(A)C [Sinorhizobium mexicanum]MBP1882036.1 copper(I)-binding protein [Sinorhizobium mexicanum]QLL61764.1 copper chaperone PCu(A)C [Sinorhizobium mexicanum]